MSINPFNLTRIMLVFLYTKMSGESDWLFTFEPHNHNFFHFVSRVMLFDNMKAQLQ